MNRSPQIVILVSAGALLFVASQWPRYTAPACVAMLAIVWLAVSRMRPGAPAGPGKRNRLRRIVGIAIAVGLLIWVVLSLRQA
jgi:hypothetical protein